MAGPATKLTTETRQVYYDVQAVRADFPIFSVRPYGKELIYLDNAASAQKPRPVLERMQRAYESEYANVHRGLYYLAHCSTEAYEAARKKIQLFLNAEAAEEIVFTRSATESINLIASSFGQMAIQEGDEIILSVLEHHSNIVPWHFLREQKGAKLIWIGLDESQKFNLDQFAAAFNKHTKLVALTHMSNVLGTILPVKEIIRIAHDHHVPVLLDGSQACVHMKVDVQHLDADFYVATGHKLYGPTGIGILYGKKKWLEQLPPFNGGGEMIEEVWQDRITYAPPPRRFEAGTPPIVQAIGLAAAVEYVQNLGQELIHTHERDIACYADACLRDLDFIQFLDSHTPCGTIIAFNMIGTHPHDVAAVLDRTGIAIRAGTHCAQPLLQHFGLTATCRVSFGLYNTFEEVDRLVDNLKKAKSFFI